MKAARLLTAIGFVISSSVVAEPYAEWGVFADGTPLSEIDTSMKIPNVSDVPILRPPGGVFITDGGEIECHLGIRTQRPVEDVCEFYNSEFASSEFKKVKPPEVGGSPTCAYYRGGDTKSGEGVLVYRDLDPAVVINGSTLVLIDYMPPKGKKCDQ